jgi:hypothetical protein
LIINKKEGYSRHWVQSCLPTTLYPGGAYVEQPSALSYGLEAVVPIAAGRKNNADAQSCFVDDWIVLEWCCAIATGGAQMANAEQVAQSG